MYKFKLSGSKYQLAKAIDFSEFADAVGFDDNDHVISVNMDRKQLKIFLATISDEIVANGMENQQEVTAYGRELYDLYDDIYEQIPD